MSRNEVHKGTRKVKKTSQNIIDKYLEPLPSVGPVPLFPTGECMCPGIFSSEFLNPSSSNIALSGSGPDLEISYGHIISLAMSILSKILSVEINDLLPVQYSHLRKFSEFSRLEILAGEGKIPISSSALVNFQKAIRSVSTPTPDSKTTDKTAKRNANTSTISLAENLPENPSESLDQGIDVVINTEVESEIQNDMQKGMEFQFDDAYYVNLKKKVTRLEVGFESVSQPISPSNPQASSTESHQQQQQITSQSESKLKGKNSNNVEEPSTALPEQHHPWEPMSNSFPTTSLFPEVTSPNSLRSSSSLNNSQSSQLTPRNRLKQGPSSGLNSAATPGSPTANLTSQSPEAFQILAVEDAEPSEASSAPSSLAVFHVSPSEWLCDPFPTAQIFVGLGDLSVSAEESSLVYTFEKHEVVVPNHVKHRHQSNSISIPQKIEAPDVIASNTSQRIRDGNTVEQTPTSSIPIGVEISSVQPASLPVTISSSAVTRSSVPIIPPSDHVMIGSASTHTWSMEATSHDSSSSGSGSGRSSLQHSYSESAFPFAQSTQSAYSDSSTSPLQYYSTNPDFAMDAFELHPTPRTLNGNDLEESYHAYSSFSSPTGMHTNAGHGDGESSYVPYSPEDINHVHKIIGELVSADVLQSDVEIVIDSLESACDFLLAKRTQYTTALLKNRESQLQETRPWELACTNHSKKLSDVIRQKKSDEILLRVKLEQTSGEVLLAKQAVDSAISLSLPASKQKKLVQSLEDTRKRRNNYLSAYERVKLECHEAMNQLSCVSDILAEMSADPARLSIAHLERTARTDLALTTFGEKNRNNLLDKVVKLAKLRREGQLIHTKIAAVGIAVRALKLRLSLIVTAYWS